jgi:hypothetical protein
LQPHGVVAVLLQPLGELAAWKGRQLGRLDRISSDQGGRSDQRESAGEFSSVDLRSILGSPVPRPNRWPPTSSGPTYRSLFPAAVGADELDDGRFLPRDLPVSNCERADDVRCSN